MTPILVLDTEADALVAQVEAAWSDVTGREMPPLLARTAAAELDAAAAAAEILLAPPDLAEVALPQLPALRWLQSTWAGVTPVLPWMRDHPQLTLTAAKGLFGPLMAQYVFGWLAVLERRVFDYHAQQQAGIWQQLPERDLCGRTLLLVGTGSIGAHLAGVAAAFGLRVLGVSRSGAAVAGIERVGTPADLHALLAEADYVVTSLPSTPAVQHLLDAEAFAAMGDDAILINVGRGSVIDDDALLQTLQAGRLRGAVLDVFDTEPLPDGHPFWTAPRLHVTPHVAAITPVDGIARLFAENLMRWEAGEALYGRVDVASGY